MDRISHLPDETITKILSFLPTKDATRTMLLSKRFKSLWMLVPRLHFDDDTYFPEEYSWRYDEPDYSKFRLFVDRSLMSREGQALESLHLKLGRKSTDDDSAIWVGTAVKRGLMELKLEHNFSCKRGCLPTSLFTCGTLVVLKLKYCFFHVPDLVSLPSLKTLFLDCITCSDAASLLRLLPYCPVLEDLLIQQVACQSDALTFKIVMPSLKRLSLLESCKGSRITGLVLDAPSLKYLRVVDRSGTLSFGECGNLSEVVKVDIEVILEQPEKLLQSLSSVEHIRLCLTASEVVYPFSCFDRLKHVEVCTCKAEWLDLFMSILENSPSLKVIKINQCHPVANPRPTWNQPSTVPSCLSLSLETLEWTEYDGTQEEQQLSTYILKTAVWLKKASFTTKSRDPKKKLEMLRELSLSQRVSSTCELVFN